MERALLISPSVLSARLDYEYSSPEHQRSYDWKQDLLIAGTVLAGVGGFFGPFKEPQARIVLLIAAVVLAVVRGLTLLRRKRSRAILVRDQNDLWLLRGAIVRRLAAQYQALVTSNDGLGWLTDGIHPSNEHVRQFHSRINPALADGTDVAALILQHPGRTYTDVTVQAKALAHSVARVRQLVSFMLSNAHAMDSTQIDRASRGKGYRAYQLWQDFEKEYREAAEPDRWTGNSPLGSLEPPLPSFT